MNGEANELALTFLPVTEDDFEPLADRAGLEVRVGALKESASNRFYRRQGFVLTREEEWDYYYVRPTSGQGQGC